MRTTYVVTACAAALTFSVVSLAQVAAKDRDDKKPAPQPPALNEEYRIGPGDKLRIEVYKDPQLSQSMQVRPDGKITLPLIGDLEATGHTPIELRDIITTSFKEYVTNPTVTVIVVEALASKVYVIGEVTRPGTMDLHGPTTILQALAMAGGLKESANTREVKVLRAGDRGAMQTIKFNYKDVLNGDTKPFLLRSGDTVVVR